MAKENVGGESGQASDKNKREQRARPLIVVYKKEPAADGSPEIVDVLRDPLDVMEMLENDPSLTYKRTNRTKIGR